MPAQEAQPDLEHDQDYDGHLQSVGPSGSHVTLTDATGRRISLRTNQVGNFYTAERLAFPLTVAVDGATMPTPVTYGGCNRCHGAGDSGGGD